MQPEFKIAGLPLLFWRLLTGPLIGATVPKGDVPCTVVSAWNRAFKAPIIERMVFHVNGEPLDRGIKGWAVRERPGFQNALHLQTQIVMQTAGAMSLNKKTVTFAGLGCCFGFRSLAKNPLPTVFF